MLHKHVSVGRPVQNVFCFAWPGNQDCLRNLSRRFIGVFRSVKEIDRLPSKTFW